VRALITSIAWLLPAVAAAAVTTDVAVKFHVSHPAKEFDSNLRGGGATASLTLDPLEIDNTRMTFSLRVDQFDSENSMRDSNMIETLEALVYPTIDWRVDAIGGAKGPLRAGNYVIDASGPLTLHGVTKTLAPTVAVTIGADGSVAAVADFMVQLDAFKVERPTLVFVAIENDVAIHVEAKWPAGTVVFAPDPPPAPAPAPAAATTAPPPGGNP
jgi:polyisoprenoid-binding protein YceI